MLVVELGIGLGTQVLVNITALRRNIIYRVVSSEISGGKFPEISGNLF